MIQPHDAALKGVRRFRAIAAALLSEQGKSQIEVVEELRRIGIEVSQPEVSRLLEFAETNKFYSWHPQVLRGPEGVTDEEWATVNNWFYQDVELQKRLQKWSPHIVPQPYVIKPPEVEDSLSTEQQVGRREQHFYPAAATYMRDLLLRSSLVGLNWGRTVSKLIDALRSNLQPEEREVRCIPLCGEPVFLTHENQTSYSASNLAEKLQNILVKGRPKYSPSLLGVPCYVRSDLLTREFKIYLQTIPGYQAIFGWKAPDQRTEEALINQVDALITSVGIFRDNDPYKVSFLYERIRQEKTKPSRPLISSEDELRSIVLGDIGGFLIGKPGLDRKKREKLNKLNDNGWTGLRDSDLTRISLQAQKNDSPGVIIIAFHQDKWETLYHVIRAGYVNKIIISEAIAKRLKEIRPE